MNFSILDTIINALALGASLLSIYLTCCSQEAWVRRFGCVVGIFAAILNLYLQVGNSPWSTWLLTIACLAINAKGANLPGLAKKLMAPRVQKMDSNHG